MAITLKTIADRAGVTPATVSRVIHGDETCFVSEKRKNAILALVEELGYAPNLAARNLALGRNTSIAFLLSDLGELEAYGPFTMTILAGLQQSLRQKGFSLSITTVGRDLRVVQEMAASDRYGGLVLAGGLIPREHRDILARFPVPMVTIDDESDYLGDTVRVRTDKHQGIAQAIAHLKELGHSRIAYYGCATLAVEMYRQALAANGLRRNDRIIFTVPTGSIYNLSLAAYASADALVEKRSHFTAVFCANDFVALGLCDRLRKEGLVPGRDISVAGFDDIEELMQVDEQKRFLTTVHKPRKEMGIRTGEILLDILQTGDRAPREEIIPSTLVVRKSTCTINRGGP